MELIIITGMSGAGKSNAVNALEDTGFYCVDNIPAKLISKFIELCVGAAATMERIALVIDVRGRERFSSLSSSLEELDAAGQSYKILFLDCQDTAIMHRYKETRRRHPLMDEGCSTIEEALAQERRLLEPARRRADYIIDTTLLTAGQLKERVASLFSDRASAMVVNCMSFGFKYGIPPEADLVFDLRSLPNPFYIEQLRPKTGLDSEVESYVFANPQANQLLEKLCDLTGFLVPLAEAEGRSQFTVAIGCTGGRHRSVAFTEKISRYLGEKGHNAIILHRDIRK